MSDRSLHGDKFDYKCFYFEVTNKILWFFNIQTKKNSKKKERGCIISKERKTEDSVKGTALPQILEILQQPYGHFLFKVI